jgi:hypothetical protein
MPHAILQLGSYRGSGKSARSSGHECASVEAHQPWGASLDANAAPASTKGATSIKLLSVAEMAATVKLQALNVLNPWVKHEAWCRLEKPLPPLREDSGEPGMSPCPMALRWRLSHGHAAATWPVRLEGAQRRGLCGREGGVDVAVQL